jgi:Holliday junction resolvase RusA-like endonuclease
MSDFVAYGHPQPKGTKTRLPNGAMLEGTPSRSKDKNKRREVARRKRVWPEVVAGAAQRWWHGPPDDVPANLCARFYLEHPTTGKQRTWHTKPPDLDKLIRSVGDSLKVAGVIRDDSIFVTFDGSFKRYARKGAAVGDPDGPRVEITVRHVV